MKDTATKLTIILAIASLVLSGRQALADPELRVCPGDFATIQGAVNAAASILGEKTIRICPGTYPENVNIGVAPGVGPGIGPGNSLEITGAGTDKVFVTGTGPGNTGPIFDVKGAGKVRISKLTVDGGSTMAGSALGIRYDGTDGEIEEAVALNIRNVAGFAGQGISIQSIAGPSSVHVHHCLIKNAGRVSIFANGAGVHVKIDHNQLEGPVPPVFVGPLGMEVARGAQGQVGHNTVRGMSFPGGAGLSLSCAGPTVMEHNKVFDANLGIVVSDNTGASVTHNEVSGSVADAYQLESGLFAAFGDPTGALGGSVTCPGGLAPITSDNTLQDNKASSSGRHGVIVRSDCPAASPCDGVIVPGPHNNTIQTNHVESSSEDGIHAFDGSDNLFERNHIKTSAGVDAVDDTAGGGTAGTADTWEKNTCAASTPAGLCE